MQRAEIKKRRKRNKHVKGFNKKEKTAQNKPDRGAKSNNDSHIQTWKIGRRKKDTGGRKIHQPKQSLDSQEDRLRKRKATPESVQMNPPPIQKAYATDRQMIQRAAKRGLTHTERKNKKLPIAIKGLIESIPAEDIKLELFFM